MASRSENLLRALLMRLAMIAVVWGLLIAQPFAQSLPPNVKSLVTDSTLKTGAVVGGNLQSYPAADLLENPSFIDSNQNGDLLYSAGTAVFFRSGTNGATTRVIQYGDSFPGSSGSRVTICILPHLNASGQAVFVCSVSKTDGTVASIVTRWTGSSLIPIASSTDAAPGQNGNLYGSTVFDAIDSNGDVAFVANQQNTVGGNLNQPVLYIAAAGGSPVRIIGYGDSAPGASGTLNGIGAVSINNGGQVLIYGTFNGSSAGVWLAQLVSGAPSITKIVAQGDALPSPFVGTFSTVLTGSTQLFLNNSGQVAFSAVSGSLALWRYTSGTGLEEIAVTGDSAPAYPYGGIISSPSIEGFGDNGSVLFTSSEVGGSASATELLLATSPHSFADVAYTGQSVPGTTGGAFSQFEFSQVMSVNSSGNVSFQAQYTIGATTAYGIFQSIPVSGGTSPPAISNIALDGDASGLSGGGTVLAANVGSVRLLDNGNTLFDIAIVGGTATGAMYSGVPGVTAPTLTALFTNADALPSGSNVAIGLNSVRAAGVWMAFSAGLAGGRTSIFAYNSSTQTLYRVVTDGDAAVGLPAGSVMSLQSVANSIAQTFINANGQLVFSANFNGSASVAPGAGVWEWDPTNGVQKVVTTNDTNPVNGLNFVLSGPISTSVASPINSSGQVYFRAGAGSFALFGGWVWTPGATPGTGTIAKAVLQGDAAPSGGTFDPLIVASGTVNEVLADNSTVYFYDSVTGGATGIYAVVPGQTPVKVAAVGDTLNTASGTTTLTGFTSAIVVNGSGQVLFGANRADGKSGLLVGGAGVSFKGIAFTGDATPAGGTFAFPLFTATSGTSNGLGAWLNDNGNVAFSTAVSGVSTTFAGVFYANMSTQQTTTVALGNDPAPGTNSGFTGFFAGQSGRASDSVSLNDAEQVYFEANAFSSPVPVTGWWRYRASAGVLDKIYVRGDSAPGTSGGQLGLSSGRMDASGSTLPVFTSVVTNSSTVLGALWQVQPATADLAVSFGGGSAPTSVALNAPLQIDFRFFNYGPSAATGAVATVSLSPSNAGTFSNYPSFCTVSNSNLVCTGTADVKPNGDSFPYTLTPTALGPVTITYSISANEPDPNPTNNTASASTTVVSGAGTFINGSSAPASPITTGTAMTYTFNVGNNGPAVPSVFTVNFAAPPGFTVTSITSPLGTCTLSPLSCVYGTPAAPWSTTITISGSANQVGTYDMVGTINDGGYPILATANLSVSLPLTVTPAAGGNEYYLVTDVFASKLHLFNAATNTETLPAVSTGSGPIAAVVSPNGRIAYIVSRSNHYVSVVDLTTRQEIERWTYTALPFKHPVSVALTADGTKLIVVAHKVVRIFNTANGQLLASPGVTNPAAVAIGGNTAWINGGGTAGVSAVDLSSYAVTTISGTTVGTGPANNTDEKTIAVSPDGRYVVAVRQSNLLLIDTVNGNAVTSIPSPSGNVEGVITTRDPNSPGGMYAYFGTDSNLIGAIDLNTGSSSFGQVVQTLTVPYAIDSAVMSLDSKTALLLATGPNNAGEIIRIDTGLLLSNPSKAITLQKQITAATDVSSVRGIADGFVVTTPPATAPTISSVSPSTFTADAAQSLTITGNNFSTDALVRIGHMPLLTPSSVTSTQIVVTVPALSPAGVGNVVVIDRNGTNSLQQQNQSGALVNGVTIGQVSTFQPAYNVATENLEESISYGTRTLSAIGLGVDFYSPTDLVFSSDGVHAYVNSATSGIPVLNLPSGSVETTIPFFNGNFVAGEAASGLYPAVSGSPAVYVATQVPNGATGFYDMQVQAIDANSTSATVNQVVHTFNAGISVASYENAVTVTSDGHYAYVEMSDVSSGATSILPMDLSTGTAGTPFTVNALNPLAQSGPVYFVGITPDNQYLVLPNTNGSSMDFYYIGNTPMTPTFALNVPLTSPATELDAFQVLPNKIVAADFLNGVLEVFGYAPGTPTTPAPTVSPLGSAVVPDVQSYYVNGLHAPVVASADGNYIYVAIQDRDMVDVFSTSAVAASNAGGALVARMATGQGPFAIALSPTALYADLAVSLHGSDNGGAAISGQTVTYYLTATNNGPANATGVVLTNSLPAGMTLVSAPGCTGTTSLTCSIGSLAYGTSAAFPVTVSISGTGSLSLAAAVSGNEPDSNSSNNSISTTINVVSGADLSISGSVAPANPQTLGSTVTLTFIATNASGDTVPTVKTNFAMPAGFVVAGTTTTTGSCSTVAPLSCDLGQFAAGQSATITITGTVNTAGTGTAVGAVGGYPDTNPANNTVSLTLTTSPLANTSEYYFVGQPYSDSLRQFSVSGNTEVTPAIATGASPVSTVISPNGRTAYVLSRAYSYVSVVDIPTRTEIARWPIPNASYKTDLVLIPDGTKLIASGNGQVTILDATSGGILATPNVPNAQSSVIVGNTLYVNVNNGGLAYVTVDLSEYVVSQVPWGESIGGGGGPGENKNIAASPDGHYLVATRFNKVELVDLNKNAVYVVPVPNGWTAHSVVITRDQSDPNGIFAFVETTNGKLLVFDLRDSQATFGKFLPQTVTLPFTVAGGMTFSSDGTEIIAAGSTVSGPLAVTATGVMATVNVATILSNPSAAVTYQATFGSKDTGGAFFRGVTDTYAFAAPVSGMPTVTSVQPSLITADSPQTFTINGTNFAASAMVRIGHSDWITPTVLSPTQLQVSLPALIPAGANALTVAVIQSSGTGAQQLFQTGVLAGALTIQQASSFQPLHQAVTLGFQASLDFGGRVLNGRLGLGRNFQVAPTGYTLSADGQRAYVISVDGITVSNLATSAVEATIAPSSATAGWMQLRPGTNPATGQPAIFALGLSQVLNTGAAQYYDYFVQVIDAQNGSPTINQVVNTVDAQVSIAGNFGSNGGFAVTPDGRYAYAPLFDNNGVLHMEVFDMSANTATQGVALPDMDQNDVWPYLNITPDGHYLLALANSDGGALVYDVVSNRTVPSLAGHISPVAPSGPFRAMQVVGSTLYTSDGPNFEAFNFFPGASPNFSFLGAYTDNDIVAETFDAVPMAVTPDGQFLYVASSNNDTVKVLSAAAVASSNSNALVASMQTSDGPLAIQLSSTGSQSTDVAVAIQAGATGADVVSGSTYSYQIVASNLGPTQATGVVVTNTLPAGTTLVSAPGCSATGTTLACAAGTVLKGSAASFTVTLSATGTTGTVLTTTASVTANENDGNPSNNTASFSVTVVGGADLFINGTATNSTPALGAPETFNVNVGNASGDTVPTLVAQFALPVGFALQSAIPSGGTCTTAAPLQCTFTNVAAGTSFTIAITGTVNQPVATELTGAVSGYADTNAANNTVSIPITVSAASGMSEYYFVAEAYSHKLHQYLLSNNTEVTPPSFAGLFPQSVVISPNGRLAYVASRFSHYISVVDLTTRTEAERWTYSGGNSFDTSLALTADGTKLVVANDGAVAILNTANGAVLAQPSFQGYRGVAVSGNKAFVNTLTNGVQAIDLSSFAVTSIAGTNVGNANYGFDLKSIAVTPDGRYVIAARKGYLVLIDTSNANQVATVAVTGGIAELVAISHDTSAANGVFAYFTLYDPTAQTSSVHLLDLRSGSTTFGQILSQSVTLPFDAGIAARSIALSADSTSLFVTGTLGTAGAYVRIDTGLMLRTPASAIVLQQAFTGPQLPGTQSTARGVTTGFALAAPVSSAPALYSVQPSTITADAAQTLTISGSNFSPDAVVRIGSMAPLVPSSISATQIQVALPALSPAQSAANVVVIDRNASSGAQLQNQTGVLAGALTILQANSFQPAHPLVTTDSDEFVGFGARNLSPISLAGHNFYEPSGMAIAPDGVRAYTGTTEGIAAVNLNTRTVEAFANAGTIVNINATQNGCSQCSGPQNVLPGTVVSILGPKVQLTLPAGTYRITNAAGLQGALYGGWNYNSSGANWVWSFMVANEATSTVLMDDYIGSTQSSLAAIAGLTNTPTYDGNTVLAATSTAGFTDQLTLTQTTTLDFFIDDYGLSDNLGGVSLLVRSVDQQLSGNLVSSVDVGTGNPVIMGVATPQNGSNAAGPLYDVQVQMIDPRDGSSTVNQVVKTVSAGVSLNQSYLGGFAVTSDGHYGYVQMSDNDTGAVSLVIFNFQAASATEVAEPAISPNQYFLGITPDNHYLLAGDANTGGLLVFDVSSTPANPALVQTVAPHSPATLYDGFAMNGSTAYALAFNTPQIHTFTYAPGATPFTYQSSYTVADKVQFPNVNDPAPMAISADGSLLYVPVVDSDMVDVLAASTVASGTGNAVIARLGSTMAPFLAAVSPNPSPAADLAVSLSIANVYDQTDLQYSFTVTNNGSAPATNVVLAINVPSGTSPSAPSGCTENGTQMTCTIASLANGASQVLTLDQGIVRGAGTVFQVSGSVYADQNDANLTNNSVSGQSTVQTAVDLQLYSVTTDKTSATAGDTVTYTFNIYNAGPDDSSAVTFTDVLAAGATFVSGTVSNSYTTGGTCTGTTTITCSVGILPYDWSATVTITLALNQGGTVVNTGTISGVEFDPITSNNFASASVQVAAVADLALSLTSTSDLASTVTVTNNGPSSASGVMLTGNVERFQVASISSSQGSTCTTSTIDGTISCPLGSLASGASATVTIALSAPSTGWAGVYFYAGANEYDPNLNNNSVRLPGNQDINTLPGLNVNVATSGSGITATVGFDSVTQPGTTSVSAAPYTASAPAGFRNGNPALVYDVSTTATHAGAIRVTLPFSPASFRHPAKVRIFHLENGAWVDRTLVADPVSGAITASTASLSPFLIAEPLNTAPVAKAQNALASATSMAGAAVKLDATQSSDADGDPLTYRWTGAFSEGGGTVTGATPTVTLAAGAHQLTLVVNDGEADSQPVQVTATVSDFQLAIANNAETVTAGQAATFPVNVGTQFNAFTNPVTLSCSNLPAGYACSFSPAQVVPGTNGATTTLTIGPAQSAQNRHVPLWPFTVAFGVVLTGGVSKRRRWLMLLMIAALLVAVACGGGTTATQSSSAPAKQATTTVITVSGTSGGVVHSATVSMTIR